MRILVSGATGFVGRALCLRLERDRHGIVAWVRSVDRAQAVLASSVELFESSADLERQVASCDAIVHLAGEAVVGKRWSAARKRALADSRVEMANRLVAALAKAPRAPRVFVSASAVGYYGDRAEERLHEDARPGGDFLARVCVDWERAAEGARAHGARVVCLRTGIVLGPEGGVLGALELPFRLGVGGRLGSGRQYVPWIHLDDLLEMYVRALVDERMDGACNATAPEPATNAEFTRALGETLRRPTILPVPKFVLRAILGEAASAPLASQRAVPARLLELGFRFAHTDLRGALSASLCMHDDVSIARAHDTPSQDYLRRRPPTHVLEQVTRMQAALEETTAFFSQAENLGALTPRGMAFKITTARPIAMHQGTIIDYTIRLGPLPLRWRTLIEVWNGSAGFADSQQRGPYRCWWHEHSFERDGDGTCMRDRVYFSAPLGVIGRLAVQLFIARKLRSIFSYRARAIAWRFGLRERAAAPAQPAPA